jgi:hypothetical protein
VALVAPAIERGNTVSSGCDRVSIDDAANGVIAT